MSTMTVAALAQAACGEIRGDAQRLISGANSLAKAGANEITYAADEQNIRKIAVCEAAACFVSRKHADNLALANTPVTLVLVDDPQDAFVSVLRLFRPQSERPTIGVSPEAHVSPTAQIGPDCNIYPGAFVDDGAVVGARCDIYPGVFIGRGSRVGDDCVLYPHAVLYSDVVVGDRVIVHASAILGADGFGYRLRNGRFEKIPQLGSVRVGDDCEIGASTTVDRGMIGATVIGTGTKLDNLVMIGHNCELGQHNALASQVGFAGSVTTGDYVRAGGQAGVRDHVHLGEGCVLLAKAGVHKDIPAGEVQIGTPAGPEQEQIRVLMSLRKVPEMRKQIRELESQLAAVTKQLQKLLDACSESEAEGAAA